MNIFNFNNLTFLMGSYVIILSLLIALFAKDYLKGDARKKYFFRWFSFGLLSVTLMTFTQNILLMVILWPTIGLSLHKLLLYYPDRPAAKLAANKKWLISRLGDFFFIAFIFFFYKALQTTNFSEGIKTALLFQDSLKNEIFLTNLFLILAVLTKSAVFPFNTWLPDTMEAPTPVSAFMHAGIINIGAFILISNFELLSMTPSLLTFLIIIGSISALIGSAAMLTQVDVKRFYAYSTIAQMGFLMIQIGLGQTTIAMLHIMAHGFYKSYSFFKSPSAIEYNQRNFINQKEKIKSFSFSNALFALSINAVLFFSSLEVLNYFSIDKPSSLFLVFIFLSSNIIFSYKTSRNSIVNSLKKSFLIYLSYSLSYAFIFQITKDVLAAPTSSNFIEYTLIAFFTLFTLVQLFKERIIKSSLGRNTFIHLYNGLYIGTIFNRITQKLI